MIEMNKDDPLLSPAVLWIASVCERKPNIKKMLIAEPVCDSTDERE